MENNQTLTVYPDGRQTITGKLNVRLENTKTGESIDVNISGPVTYAPNDDGTFTGVFRGRSLIFPNDDTIMFVSSGRVIMRVSGDFSSFSLMNVVGGTRDVCAELR